jgi:predicted kinase
LLSLLALDADGAPGALMLRSAVERKAMFGVDETTNLCAGGYARRLPAYRRQGPARVESRAGRRARRDILDRAGATGGWRRRGGSRRRFDGLFLEATLETRLARVGARQADASDADVSVARNQRAEPLGEQGWTEFDAGGGLSETIALPLERLLQ